MAAVELLHPKTLILNLALAAAYGLIGWAATLLALSPGHALPIFPSAGLALAAVLVGGSRMYPGVYVGSLTVVWLVGTAAGGSAHPWALALVPTAAVLQAAVGAALMRRWIGYPAALDSPAEIVRFLAAVAPLGALTAASLAVPLLVLLGQSDPASLPEQWFVWWFGDTLGVMVATPIALSLFGSPQSDWRPRRRSLALPLTLATCVLASILHQIGVGEQQRAHAEFTRHAGLLAHQLEQRLSNQADMLHNAQRMVAVSQFVDRREWREFVTPWFDRHPGMLNFTWNPLVREAERKAFVAAVRSEGFPDFEIVDRIGDGKLQRAAAGTDGYYLPITYVEPFARNGRVFGLDPLSVAATANAIRDTLAQGEMRASEPFRLTQELADQVGVVLYLRVQKTIAGKLQTVGLVSSALRMGDLMEAALYGRTRAPYALCLIDVGSGGTTRLAGAEGCEQGMYTGAGVQAYRRTIAFAGRDWQLEVRPSAIGNAAGRESTMIFAGERVTMLIGLAALALLSGFLLLTTGRTRRIEELVERRTTELAAASRTLIEHRQALTEAQRIAGLGSWQLDELSDDLACSPQCRRLLDLGDDGTIGLDALTAAFEPQDQTRLRDAIADVRNHCAEHGDSRRTLDCARIDRHGMRHTAHLVVEGHRDDAGNIRLRGTVQDVTAARDAEARIRKLADFDGLTGLPNRAYWMSHARRALSAARRHGDHLAVLFIDLDNFKNVNDSLGHQTGDRLLGVVAERLASSLREEDLLARLGGDEFVALLSRLDHPDGAATVASKLLALHEQPIVIDDHSLPLSMSIGIARFPDDGTDVDTLLRNADMAMYGAKGAGRNAFQHFVPEMNARALERLQLDNALRHALLQEQFFLVYQPQVDVDRGRVVGYEALLRWRHPELGLVSPERFIPAAEISGLIVPIGDWVMTTAFRQQMRLRANGSDCAMAINISALQFRRDDFVTRVEQAMAATGVAPKDIEFEITESALMDPTPELLRRLDRLRGLGIRLALDDFGTGYSSLSYLKRLPIQTLKIDRSFVSDLPGDTEDAAIASATLSMASDLGVAVVAEGVETDAQRDFLRQRGCRLMQGYLFSRPLPADELTPAAPLAAAG